MLATLETPPIVHYPASPRVNSARSEGADLIEPAASLGVFSQAGIAWGQLLNMVREFCLKINSLEGLFDRGLRRPKLNLKKARITAGFFCGPLVLNSPSENWGQSRLS